MPKGVSISARISQEDAEFIGNLNVEGAKTPSDKVRALISEARKRSLGKNDYSGTLQYINELINPNIIHIREAEFAGKIHSELMQSLYEWLPDFVAFLISSSDSDMKKIDLIEIEKGCAERLFRLLESVLLIEISETRSVYDQENFNHHIEILNRLFTKIIKIEEYNGGLKNE